MKARRAVFVALAMMSVLVVALSVEAKKYKIGYNPPVGLKAVYEQQTNIKTQIKMPEATQQQMPMMPQTMTMSTKLETQQWVKEKTAAGNFLVEMEILNYDMDMGTGMPHSDMTKQMAEKIKGQKFSLEMSPEGKIVKMEGGEGLAETMGMMGGEKQWKEMISNMVEQYMPAKEVGIGESWENEIKVPMGFGQGPQQEWKAKVISTLADVKQVEGKETAEIKWKFVVAPTTMTQQPGMEMKFSGEGNGVSLYELKNSVDRGTEFTMKMKTEMMMPSPEGQPGSMTMEMDISGETKLKSLEMVKK